MTAAIEVQGLRYAWPGQPPLLDVAELSIERGAKVFLHGPSGSGKSTLLALLGGVRQADAGELRILGTSLAAMGGARRDRFRADHIGFVFQLFNLLPYLDVRGNVLLPCRFSASRAARARARHADLHTHADALLEALDLPPDVRARRVESLSVGQQQRVAVARALAGAPELVICDEPTSALDSDTRQRFLDLLFQCVHEAGSTLVFVSHDRELATRFDRTLALAELNRAGSTRAAA